MKFFDKNENRNPVHYLELTERNLKTLLEKLSDPNSEASILDGSRSIIVRAVHDDVHYADRPAGKVYTNGEYK